MSTIFDAAAILIAVAIIWISYRKGFVRSVIELAGYVAAFVASWYFSTPLGGWIYTHLLKSALHGLVSGYLSAVTGSAQQTLNSLLGQYHITGAAQLFDGASVKSGQDAADSLVMSTVVAPLGQSIGRGIAFVVVFLLCLAAVKIVAGATDVIFKLPVIGSVNRVGGAAIGVIKAAVVLCVLSTAVAVLIPLLSLSKNPPVTSSTINNTVIYKYIYDGNPLKGILLKG